MPITTTQLHSTKSELRFCTGSNPVRGLSEVCDGEYRWERLRLEMRLNRLMTNVAYHIETSQVICTANLYDGEYWSLVV